MHQKLFLLYFAFTISNFSFSQTIDKLNTNEEVLNFVRKLNPQFANLSIEPFKPVYGSSNYKTKIKSFGGVSFAKADFDNNGKTDLLFNGFMDDYKGNKTCRFFSFVIMSFGQDSFSIKELTLGTFVHLFSSKIIDQKNIPFILVLRNKYKTEHIKKTNSSTFVETIDTLNYFEGDFIETTNFTNYKINNIKFCTFGGMSMTYNFGISIFNDSATLLGDTSSKDLINTDSIGLFKTCLDISTKAKIINLLNHINFSALEKQYAVSWTDDVEGTITVNYDDGKSKKINDYGLIGTYGLAAFENILMKLITTQKWKKLQSISPWSLPICN